MDMNLYELIRGKFVMGNGTAYKHTLNQVFFCIKFYKVLINAADSQPIFFKIIGSKKYKLTHQESCYKLISIG